MNQEALQQIFLGFGLAFIFFSLGVIFARRFLSPDPLGNAIKHLNSLADELKGLNEHRVVKKTFPIPEELEKRRASIEEYRQVMKDKELELKKLDDANTQSVRQWWRDVEKELGLTGDPELRYNEETKMIELLGEPEQKGGPHGA